MEKIKRMKDDWGEWVIYVEKCKKFNYEDPEVPKNPIFDLHNPELYKIYDIMDVVENYFDNSGK